MMNKDREGATLPTQKLKYEPPRIEVYSVDLRESLLAVSDRYKVAPKTFQGIIEVQSVNHDVFGDEDYEFGETDWVQSTDKGTNSLFNYSSSSSN